METREAVVAEGATVSVKNAKPERRPPPPGKGGVVLPPGTGRPRGVRNKLTNLRDAVIQAFDQVGGVQYLVQLANGTQSDRAAFCGLMSKVLPTQINANVDGGIRLELGWLGARSIGTITAQPAQQITQTIDLQRDSAGKYQILDQHTQAAAGVGPVADIAQEPVGSSASTGG